MQPRPQTGPRYSLVFGLLGVVLVLLAGVRISQFLPHRQRSYDFSHSYLAARVLAADQPLYQTPLLAHAPPGAGSFENAPDEYASNPPLLVWLYLPLAGLEPLSAFRVVVLVQVLSLLGLILLAVRLLPGKLSAAEWLLVFGLTCCSLPVLAHFHYSQAQLPIAVLLLAGYFLWQRGADLPATGWLTFVGLIKFFPLAVAPLPILLARTRRRRVMLLGVALATGLLGLLLPGPQVWWNFLEHGLAHLAGFSDGRYYNFTLLSLTRGLTQHWTAAWALPICLAFNALVLVFAWRRCRATAADDSFCLLMVAAVLCSPTAWLHYLVLLFYPLVRLSVDIKAAAGGARYWRVGLLASCLLLFNTAGGSLLPGSTGGFRFLLAHLPTLAIVLLFVYFSTRVRGPGQPAAAACPTDTASAAIPTR